MTLKNIVEAGSENELSPLIEINAEHLGDAGKKRLIEDFNRAYFRVYYHLKEANARVQGVDSISAYVVTYFSYSTWQNRVLSISDFWLDTELDEPAQVDIIEHFRLKLFSVARENNCKRINFHVKDSPVNQIIIKSLEKFGMANLTRDEDWNFFELGKDELVEFIKDQPVLSSKYRVLKVEDMSLYAKSIHGLIHELSVFEKMQDQFDCSIEELLVDYDAEKCPSKLRFYESMVALNERDQVVGFAIYYPMYNLKHGFGYYLEDLYIKEEDRRAGLGTALWKQLAKDCVNLTARYLQWAVLGWNSNAISFYNKFKAVNLTQTEQLTLYRFFTHQIYDELLK